MHRKTPDVKHRGERWTKTEIRAISRALQTHDYSRAEDDSNFNIKFCYKHMVGKFNLDGTKLASKLFSFFIQQFTGNEEWGL